MPRGERREEVRDRRLLALLQSSRAITASHNLVQSIGTVKAGIVGIFDGAGCPSRSICFRRTGPSSASFPT